MPRYLVKGVVHSVVTYSVDLPEEHDPKDLKFWEELYYGEPEGVEFNKVDEDVDSCDFIGVEEDYA